MASDNKSKIKIIKMVIDLKTSRITLLLLDLHFHNRIDNHYVCFAHKEFEKVSFTYLPTNPTNSTV